MSDSVYEKEMIRDIVKPIADKYRIREVYLFGSYARGEATRNSDLDFLVYGGEQFKRTMIFAFAEDLRNALEKMSMCLRSMRSMKIVIFIIQS